MDCVCKYNPVRDVQAVEQFGFIDLVSANATSSIPSDLSLIELQYNEIDDPRSIGGRPADIFDAMQISKAITGYVPPQSDKTE